MPRMSLELVVVAIVILVVALVVLTIFGTGITPFATLADFKNNCINTGKLTCETTGTPPFTWDQKANVGGKQKSCGDSDVVGAFSSHCNNKIWT